MRTTLAALIAFRMPVSAAFGQPYPARIARTLAANLAKDLGAVVKRIGL